MRVDPAGSDLFPLDDLEGLLDDARRWRRVGDDVLIDPPEFLSRALRILLGAAVDGGGGRLDLAPSLRAGWRSLAVRRLRAHRTLFDIEVKRRAEWVTVRLAVMFGPPIAVRLALGGHEPVSRVTVDEVPLGGDTAVFTASGEHEVTLYLGRPALS